MVRPARPKKRERKREERTKKQNRRNPPSTDVDDRHVSAPTWECYVPPPARPTKRERGRDTEREKQRDREKREERSLCPVKKTRGPSTPLLFFTTPIR